MQLLEQRISQFMVSIITAIFVTRYVYYYVKAPDMMQQQHVGFASSMEKLTSVDRMTFAWQRANTGK